VGLRDKLRRLERAAAEGAVLIRLRDGTIRVFDNMTCHKEMFLAQLELFKGEGLESEVLDTVRQATPESRAAFEEKYGSITMQARVIEGGFEGAWVKEHKLLEDGTVEYNFYEGGSEEAERIRLALQRGSGPF